MEKNELTFGKNTVVSDISTESGCDYTLPDYKTDVKKLLYTTACVLPSSSFPDSGEICSSGIVNYSVIYLDTENKVCGAEFSSDYDFSVKCAEEFESYFLDTALAAFSVRLVGPRKFTARATLCSTLDLLTSELLEEEGDAFSAETERDIKRILCSKRRRFNAPERTLAEKLADFDGVIADDLRVIYSAAKPKIHSAELTDSGIEVKGAVEVTVLAECAGLSPEIYKCAMPFEECLEQCAIADGAHIFADGFVSSLRISVNPAEFGCNMTADVIVEIFVTVTESDELALTVDAYSLKGESVAESRKITYERYIDSISDKIPTVATVARDALSLSEAREIVFTDAKLKVDSVYVKDADIVFDGELRFFGIASEPQGEGVGYVNFKHTLPVCKILKAQGGLDDTAKIRCNAEVYDPKGLFDKDSVELSATVALEISYGEMLCERYISSLTFTDGEREEKRQSRITVYYPAKGETLFDVAKKFRTTVKDIAVNNSLSESVVSSGASVGVCAKKLIIK